MIGLPLEAWKELLSTGSYNLGDEIIEIRDGAGNSIEFKCQDGIIKFDEPLHGTADEPIELEITYRLKEDFDDEIDS